MTKEEQYKFNVLAPLLGGRTLAGIENDPTDLHSGLDLSNPNNQYNPLTDSTQPRLPKRNNGINLGDIDVNRKDKPTPTSTPTSKKYPMPLNNDEWSMTDKDNLERIRGNVGSTMTPEMYDAFIKAQKAPSVRTVNRGVGEDLFNNIKDKKANVGQTDLFKNLQEKRGEVPPKKGNLDWLYILGDMVGNTGSTLTGKNGKELEDPTGLAREITGIHDSNDKKESAKEEFKQENDPNSERSTKLVSYLKKKYKDMGDVTRFDGMTANEIKRILPEEAMHYAKEFDPNWWLKNSLAREKFETPSEDLMNKAVAAKQSINDMSRLSQLIDNGKVPTDKLGTGIENVKNFIGQGNKDYQEYQSLKSGLMQQIQKGTAGALSDKDVKIIQEAMPNLDKGGESAKKALETIKRTVSESMANNFKLHGSYGKNVSPLLNMFSSEVPRESKTSKPTIKESVANKDGTHTFIYSDGSTRTVKD